MLIAPLLIFCSYLLGSIPTSIWYGKIFHHIDVRNFGSGNAGATNTARVLGRKAGIIVFIFDVLKGWLAVNLIFLLNKTAYSADQLIYFKMAFGVTAFLGHVFPLYAGFKGGKGVACLLGVVLAIHPWASLSAFGIFIITLLITRYVSVSSMTAALSFPLLLIVVFGANNIILIIFSIILLIGVIITHRKNISRLLNKTEPNANFLFKRKRK